MTNNLIVIALGTLLSASVLAGSAVPSAGGAPVLPTVQGANPCAFVPDPSGPKPSSPKLGPPTNLRIVGGSGGSGFEEEEGWPVSGPHVEDAVGNDAVSNPASAYFDLLSARPDCHVAYAMRSQAEIDAIPRGGGDDGPDSIRYPIYDAAQDAMLQRTRNGGNAIQKQPRLNLKGTSMLLTYDFKIGAGAEYKGEDYLQQYKAYRIDHGSNAGLWLSTKLKFKNDVDLAGQPAIAELLTTASGGFLGPGTTNVNSEILQPRVAKFFPKVNTWTRYWCLVEGSLGGAAAVKTEVVFVSIWAADERTEPVQLYDRLQMYSPVEDIRQFRFEFNTSEPARVNPISEFWDRNFVVLKGLTLADARALLQKPVR